MIADVHRQIIEYRPFGNSLQTLDANVADREGVVVVLRANGCPEELAGERRQTEDAKFKPHAARTVSNFDERGCAANAVCAAGTWV